MMEILHVSCFTSTIVQHMWLGQLCKAVLNTLFLKATPRNIGQQGGVAELF